MENVAHVERLAPGARAGHTAVRAGSSVLIWGGFDEPELSDEKYLPHDEVWLYDPDSSTWTKRLTSGDVPPGLSGACAVMLDSEQAMYLIGGHGYAGKVNSVYRLNIRSFQWQHIVEPEPPHNFSPRDKFAAWDHQDKLYVFGGYGPDVDQYLHGIGEFFWDAFPHCGWNNQLLEFDPSSSHWSLVHSSGSIPSPRAAHGTAKLGRQVYVFGGRHDATRLNDLYVLDMSEFFWTRITIDAGLQPVGRSWHSFTPLTSRHVFLYGGYTNDQRPLADRWLLDVESMQWHDLGVTDDPPRLWHTATAVNDGEVVIFGGCHGDILSHEEIQKHSNTVVIFRIKPSSLLQLSLRAASLYYDVLQSQYSQLPRHLLHRLNEQLTGLNHTVVNSFSGSVT